MVCTHWYTCTYNLFECPVSNSYVEVVYERQSVSHVVVIIGVYGLYSVIYYPLYSLDRCRCVCI